MLSQNCNREPQYEIHSINNLNGIEVRMTHNTSKSQPGDQIITCHNSLLKVMGINQLIPVDVAPENIATLPTKRKRGRPRGSKIHNQNQEVLIKRKRGRPSGTKKKNQRAIIPTVKKKRGRPLGSKNKNRWQYHQTLQTIQVASDNSPHAQVPSTLASSYETMTRHGVVMHYPVETSHSRLQSQKIHQIQIEDSDKEDEPEVIVNIGCKSGTNETDEEGDDEASQDEDDKIDDRVNSNISSRSNNVLGDKTANGPETFSRLDEIHKEINSLWQEEKRIVEEREETFKLTIRQLQSRLTEAIKYSLEARGAQAAAESRLSQIRMEMEKKITELMDKNAKLEDVIRQRTVEDTEKIKTATARMLELRQKFLKANSPSHREIYLKTTELQETKSKIQELETEKICLRKIIQDLQPKAALVETLEKKLQLANQTIFNLGGTDMRVEVSEDQVAACDRQLEDPINIEDDVIGAQEALLRPGPHQEPNEATVNGRSSTAPEYEFFDLTGDIQGVDNESLGGWEEHTPILVSDDDGSSSSLQIYEGEENTSGVEANRIRVGAWYIVPSDATFFQINWENEFKRFGKNYFKCNSCNTKAHSRGHIEDHVWSKHHQGRLLCPLCPPDVFSLENRYFIKNHVKEAHGGAIPD